MTTRPAVMTDRQTDRLID